jgi:hypothetical protein
MIGGIVASAAPVNVQAAPALPAELIGEVGTASNFSGSPTLSVPAGAQAGDTLIALLRCRGDRSFTIPAGWTLHLNRDVGFTADATGRTRLYVVSKAYAGESSVTFSQSISAACAAVLIVVRGGVAQFVDAVGSSVSAPTAPGRLLLMVATNSNVTTQALTWFSPFAAVNGFAFFSGGTQFFNVAIASHATSTDGSLSCSYSWSEGVGGANHACVIGIDR